MAIWLLPTYDVLFICSIPFTNFRTPQTDGLSDNVFPTETISICSLVARTGGSEDEQVQAMADRIVDYARQCMANRRRVSPFERMFVIFLHSSKIEINI